MCTDSLWSAADKASEHQRRQAYVPGRGAGQAGRLVHGAITDYRTWEGQREVVAAHNRFIALAMRYFGTDPWPDEGAKYSMRTHTDDLVAFIQNLNAGPVDLVGWSYSGPIALLIAVQHPELGRSLFLDEPSTLALVTDPGDLKIATEDRRAIVSPATAAVKAGDTAGPVKSLFNGVNGQPDLFDTVPPAIRAMLLDNARTLPLSFAAPPRRRQSLANNWDKSRCQRPLPSAN
jgi:pimeloyl-ACP methyl ester carboxylesterase